MQTCTADEYKILAWPALAVWARRIHADTMPMTNGD